MFQIWKFPFPRRDKYPQVTCLSNIPVVGTWLYVLLAGWDCSASSQFDLELVDHIYVCVSEVAEWEAWSKQVIVTLVILVYFN
jgi:hypothetical protein